MKKLHPAQIDDLITGLGLDRKEAANMLGVTMRKIHSWTNGQDDIPEAIAKTLLDMEDLVEEYTYNIMEEIDEQVEKKGSILANIPMVRYMGNAMFRKYKPDLCKIFTYFKIYNTVITRVRIECARDQMTVIPINFDPESYEKYLGSNEDTETHRTAWVETVAPSE